VRVMPIRYTTDVAALVSFYRAIGLEVDSSSRPGTWVELPAAGGMLALHRVDTPVDAGACELSFEADEPLEKVVERLRAAGFTPEPILDEAFGRSVRVMDPDGVWVQVNENERELYT
jgi:catechol 2,3-dioxygenase-like lactoylglutathione lyase family enzyme